MFRLVGGVGGRSGDFRDGETVDSWTTAVAGELRVDQ